MDKKKLNEMYKDVGHEFQFIIAVIVVMIIIIITNCI